jgi:hypothetical protein
MLWAIAVILATLWWLGMITGYAMGLFIHVLIAAAVILLLVSINREVSIYQELKQELKEAARIRRYKKLNSGGIGL